MKLFALLLACVSVVSAEFITIENLLSEDGESATFESSLGGGKRKLALDVGTLASINATTDTCQLIGPKISCSISTTITAEDFSSSAVNVLVECPLDSQVAFDFRRAVGCACGAEITPSGGGIAKFCPCVVCPMGFGKAPMSIDCTNPTPVIPANAGLATPFVIDKCTFLDCGFGCNGTCSFDCEKSGPSCSFCANNPNAPTLAPTGIDGGSKPPTLITSAASGRLSWNCYFFVTLVAGAVFMF